MAVGRLSILMVSHMPWDENLGGTRPQIELAKEFRRARHCVEKYDYHDAFGSARRSLIGQVVGRTFRARAEAFIRQHRGRYDIIDAHHGTIVVSKARLGFTGLLVARSAGLIAFHEERNRTEAICWPGGRRGNPLAGMIGAWIYRREWSEWRRSFEVSDLINVPNADEYHYVRDIMGYGRKCVILPCGLSDEQLVSLGGCAEQPSSRLSHRQIVFIGSWSPRKGSRDWGQIVARMRQLVPGARFLFLGTGCPPELVLRDLDVPRADFIEVIPRYDNGDLPRLLRGAAVGAFPSYMEGFGIAALEKLASGLPTIAYDVPGPREILQHMDESLLVPAGEVEEFCIRLSSILFMQQEAYAKLSSCCREVAARFSYTRIAQETLRVYTDALRPLSRKDAASG